MCGIAGFYNGKDDFSNEPKKNFKILNNMLKTMKMRGPDCDGFSIIKSCCFAHARLSIIDIDNGSQPFTIKKENASFHIIFNGEIYNHVALRNELIADGYEFTTKSDTEVILTLYIRYGPAFVERLNGIFAIAIYDEQLNTLFLYRDNFGIKPLFYTTLGNTIIFASRIDTLFEYPRVKPAIDIKGFNEIFTIGPAKTYGSGVFTGIKEVLPGEYIKAEPDKLTRHTYYRLRSLPHTDSFEDTVEKTRYLLEDAIRGQLISDVPICTFLSGGIDSSLVSAIAAANIPNISTYSFDFIDNDKFFTANSFQNSEDRPYVDIMKNYIQSEHRYLYCSNEKLADLLCESVDSRCLPTMADIDSSLLYFCREVSKHHKVVLTGECADEIFGGYPWFYREEMIKANTFPWMPDISFRKSLLNPEFAAVMQMEKYVSQSYQNTISEIELLPEENELERSRRRISYLNIKWFMQTLLDRMDRTSMHSGLEARVPFADKRIVDYLFNVPWKYKFANNTPKGLLREAAAPYLPPEIFSRPKNPYPKTYNPKYEGLLADRLKEIINDSSSPLKSYLNIKNVNAFIDGPKEYGKPWYGQLMAGPQMLAYLIQVDYFMRKYSLSF